MSFKRVEKCRTSFELYRKGENQVNRWIYISLSITKLRKVPYTWLVCYVLGFGKDCPLFSFLFLLTLLTQPWCLSQSPQVALVDLRQTQVCTERLGLSFGFVGVCWWMALRCSVKWTVNILQLLIYCFPNLQYSLHYRVVHVTYVFFGMKFLWNREKGKKTCLKDSLFQFSSFGHGM